MHPADVPDGACTAEEERTLRRCSNWREDQTHLHFLDCCTSCESAARLLPFTHQTLRYIMTHLSLWRDNSLTLVPTAAVNKAANQSADLGKKERSNVRRLSTASCSPAALVASHTRLFLRMLTMKWLNTEPGWWRSACRWWWRGGRWCCRSDCRSWSEPPIPAGSRLSWCPGGRWLSQSAVRRETRRGLEAFTGGPWLQWTLTVANAKTFKALGCLWALMWWFSHLLTACNWKLSLLTSLRSVFCFPALAVRPSVCLYIWCDGLKNSRLVDLLTSPHEPPAFVLCLQFIFHPSILLSAGV